MVERIQLLRKTWSNEPASNDIGLCCPSLQASLPRTLPVHSPAQTGQGCLGYDWPSSCMVSSWRRSYCWCCLVDSGAFFGCVLAGAAMSRRGRSHRDQPSATLRKGQALCLSIFIVYAMVILPLSIDGVAPAPASNLGRSVDVVVLIHISSIQCRVSTPLSHHLSPSKILQRPLPLRQKFLEGT